MIYFILILFFLSLISIVFMIGRKLVLIQNGKSFAQEESFEIPYLKELRHLTIKNIKKYEHRSLVAILRFYVQSTNHLKDRYKEIKNKIKNRMKKNRINTEKAEVSNFLKMISDYTRKVREIKHKIHEEEKEL